jgi:hypothetical protein
MLASSVPVYRRISTILRISTARGCRLTEPEMRLQGCLRCGGRVSQRSARRSAPGELEGVTGAYRYSTPTVPCERSRSAVRIASSLVRKSSAPARSPQQTCGDVPVRNFGREVPCSNFKMNTASYYASIAQEKKRISF